jgi:uncharacterized protein (DUF1800 family)
MDRRSAIKQGLSWLGGTSSVANPSSGTDSSEAPLPTLSANTSLAPFQPSIDQPWDRRRAMHLLRRTGFVRPPAQVANFLNTTPSNAVDQLIQISKNIPKIAAPTWADIGAPPRDATDEERQAYQQQRNQWTGEFRNTLSRHIIEGGLSGSLTLFWHNHFVTEFSDYGNMPQYAWRYIQTIQNHQFGSFKDLTVEMGLNPAMLLYLNGNLNRRQSPNENYARELLELFTLGEGNGYSQQDIEEMARALTGYQVNNVELSVIFSPARFDTNTKTIFGKTGNYNFESVHELLFTERREEIAHHICRELYRYFVYPEAPEAVVDQMASIFLQQDMQIEPVLRALFKSQHFMDDELIGAMVSAPVDHFGNFLRLLNAPRSPQDLRQFYTYTGQTGQIVLQPPDVSGWRGHRNWLDTSTLPTRWNLMQQYITRYRTQLLDLAKTMPEPNKPFDLARDLAEYMLAVPLTDEEYTHLGNVLLGGSPSYEWNIDSDGASSRVQALVSYIVLLPEFQLN